MQVFRSLIVVSYLLLSYAACASLLETVHQEDGLNVQTTIPDNHQPDLIPGGIKAKLAEESANTGKEAQSPPTNPPESKQSADETEVSGPVVTDSKSVTIPPVLRKDSFRHCIETSTGKTFKWCLIEKRPDGCPLKSYDTLNALFKGHFCSGGGDSAVKKTEQATTTNPTDNHHLIQFMKTFESFLGNVIGMTLDEVKKLESFETRMVDMMREFHKIRENVTQELLSENKDGETKAGEPKNVKPSLDIKIGTLDGRVDESKNEKKDNTGSKRFGTQSNQSSNEEKVEEPMGTPDQRLQKINSDISRRVGTQLNQSNHEGKVEEPNPVESRPTVALDKPKNQTLVETETNVHEETEAVPIDGPGKLISASDTKSLNAINAQIDTKNGLEVGQQEQDVDDVMTDTLGQVAGRENKKDALQIHSA